MRYQISEIGKAFLTITQVDEQEAMVEYYLKRELPEQDLETWIG